MILEKLKAALRAAGLSEELANHINITSEDQIQGIVASLKPTSTGELDFEKVLASEEFSQFVKEQGFDNVIKLSKAIQSGHDLKVTQGVQTFKEKFIKDPNHDGNQKPTSGDEPEWLKALNKRLDSLETKGQQATKLEQAQSLMKASSLPENIQEKWISRIQLESETSFVDQIKALEEEHTGLFKDHVVKHSGGGLPFGAGRGESEKLDSIKSMGEAFVENRKK